MINATPKWLQIAIDFINQEFPNDEDVNMCLLYGYDCMLAADGVSTSDGKYIPSVNTIYLADYRGLSEHYGGANTSEDIAILNLFHEYGHHRQYINNEKYGDEEDAESFAINMWYKYLEYEKTLKV